MSRHLNNDGAMSRGCFDGENYCVHLLHSMSTKQIFYSRCQSLQVSMHESEYVSKFPEMSSSTNTWWVGTEYRRYYLYLTRSILAVEAGLTVPSDPRFRLARQIPIGLYSELLLYPYVIPSRIDFSCLFLSCIKSKSVENVIVKEVAGLSVSIRSFLHLCLQLSISLSLRNGCRYPERRKSTTSNIRSASK